MKDVVIASDCFLGDSGKGTLTDFLASEMDYGASVRYNGGPQAGHHVVRPDGKVHRYRSFGSCMFVPDTRSHFASTTLVKIGNIEDEEEALNALGISDAIERLTIDPSCTLIMPYHVMIGRMIEAARRANRHGSVGVGVGQAVLQSRRTGNQSLTFGDLQDASYFRKRAGEFWQEYATEGLRMIEESGDSYVEKIYQSFIDFIDVNEMVNRQLRFIDRHPGMIKNDSEFFDSISGSIVLEGAQGALLDEEYGFLPHITRSCTLASGGEKLLKNSKIDGKVRKMGILRAYATRHGAGPFPTESKELLALLPEPYQVKNQWTGEFRVGYFDLVLAKYALSINTGLDFLAMTCLDRLSALEDIQVCQSYCYTGDWDPNLEYFFEVEKGETIEILALKTRVEPREEDQRKLTEYLFKCVPYRFKQFRSWADRIDKEHLPEELLSFLSYLQGGDALNLPIDIISVGPTAKDKVILRQSI